MADFDGGVDVAEAGQFGKVVGVPRRLELGGGVAQCRTVFLFVDPVTFETSARLAA